MKNPALKYTAQMRIARCAPHSPARYRIVFKINDRCFGPFYVFKHELLSNGCLAYIRVMATSVIKEPCFWVLVTEDIEKSIPGVTVTL